MNETSVETVAVPVADLVVTQPTIWARLQGWPRRRWVAAAASALAIVAIIGISTAMVPTPIFGRAVPTTWWAWPMLAITGILGGLLTATYVRDPAAPPRESRYGLAGGLLSYFAVGCPVCNKLALLALGYTGALQWFAPVQPFMGLIGIGLIGWALWQRLAGENTCPTPAS